MKFTTYLRNGQPRLGLLDGESVIDVQDAQPQVPSDLRCRAVRGPR